MTKFIALNVSHLRLDDLGGLVSETVNITTPQAGILGTVGAAKLQTLTTANNTFHTLLNKQRASELTPQIKEKDEQRDALLAEVKRTAKTGQKSSLPAMAAAGNKIVAFFTPIWNIGKESIMSQTDEIKLLQSRYTADATLTAAAATLGISTQMQNLFTVNTALHTLYNERLDKMSDIEGPSATSLKKEVVKDYNGLCGAVEITLSALPTTALQKLFTEMNDIRRKYISRLPTPLDPARTSVAPIPEQPYTGRHITPLPRVFFQTDTELRELVFSQDFTVTYRNNTKVGEAQLFVHGKGKYTGRYNTTFHIARQ
jgi:hypothetical protein